MEEHKINPLKASEWVKKSTEEYWEYLRTARERGDKVAWVTAGGVMLTNAMGMATMVHANYAARIGAKHLTKELLDACASEGHFANCCSYVRVTVGNIIAEEKGLQIPEEARLPMPDLIIGNHICPEGATMAELWYRKLKCPIAVVHHDASGCETEADFEERAHFYERQLREEVIPVIEKVCGRPYDYDRLSEMLANMKKVSQLRKEILELQKSRPSPMTIFDVGTMLGPIIAWPFRADNVKFYSDLKAEVEERVRQGIGAVTNEKYRLYWDSYTMWAIIGAASRIIVPRGANITIGRYPIVGFWPNPDLIWPEKPLYSLCYGELRLRSAQCLPKNYIPFVADLVEQYSCDGVLVPSSPTCRHYNMGQEDLIDEMERRFGIPGVMFEADMVDPAFFSRAQLETKLQALLEMIDARRRH